MMIVIRYEVTISYITPLVQQPLAGDITDCKNELVL